jgi:hypothetical protein
MSMEGLSMPDELPEEVRSFLRDGKGLEALQAAEQAGVAIDRQLTEDALDATSMSLAFARTKKSEHDIQRLESEIEEIKLRWRNLLQPPAQ